MFVYKVLKSQDDEKSKSPRHNEIIKYFMERELDNDFGSVDYPKIVVYDKNSVNKNIVDVCIDNNDAEELEGKYKESKDDSFFDGILSFAKEINNTVFNASKSNKIKKAYEIYENVDMLINDAKKILKSGKDIGEAEVANERAVDAIEEGLTNNDSEVAKIFSYFYLARRIKENQENAMSLFLESKQKCEAAKQELQGISDSVLKFVNCIKKNNGDVSKVNLSEFVVKINKNNEDQVVSDEQLIKLKLNEYVKEIEQYFKSSNGDYHDVVDKMGKIANFSKFLKDDKENVITNWYLSIMGAAILAQKFDLCKELENKFNNMGVLDNAKQILTDIFFDKLNKYIATNDLSSDIEQVMKYWCTIFSLLPKVEANVNSAKEVASFMLHKVLEAGCYACISNVYDAFKDYKSCGFDVAFLILDEINGVIDENSDVKVLTDVYDYIKKLPSVFAKKINFNRLHSKVVDLLVKTKDEKVLNMLIDDLDEKKYRNIISEIVESKIKLSKTKYPIGKNASASEKLNINFNILADVNTNNYNRPEFKGINNEIENNIQDALSFVSKINKDIVKVRKSLLKGATLAHTLNLDDKSDVNIANAEISKIAKVIGDSKIEISGLEKISNTGHYSKTQIEEFGSTCSKVLKEEQYKGINYFKDTIIGIINYKLKRGDHNNHRKDLMDTLEALCSIDKRENINLLTKTDESIIFDYINRGTEKDSDKLKHKITFMRVETCLKEIDALHEKISSSRGLNGVNLNDINYLENLIKRIDEDIKVKHWEFQVKKLAEVKNNAYALLKIVKNRIINNNNNNNKIILAQNKSDNEKRLLDSINSIEKSIGENSKSAMSNIERELSAIQKDNVDGDFDDGKVKQATGKLSKVSKYINLLREEDKVVIAKKVLNQSYFKKILNFIGNTKNDEGLIAKKNNFVEEYFKTMSALSPRLLKGSKINENIFLSRNAIDERRKCVRNNVLTLDNVNDVESNFKKSLYSLRDNSKEIRKRWWHRFVSPTPFRSVYDLESKKVEGKIEKDYVEEDYLLNALNNNTTPKKIKIGLQAVEQSVKQGRSNNSSSDSKDESESQSIESSSYSSDSESSSQINTSRKAKYNLHSNNKRQNRQVMKNNNIPEESESEQENSSFNIKIEKGRGNAKKP